MLGSEPARIFISYSRKDGADYAQGLRQELEITGFSIWQDLVALEGGRDWWSQIEAALRSKELEHFVLIVTPMALASAIVRREIHFARQEGKSFIPIKGPELGDLSKLPRWLGHLYDLSIPDQYERLRRVLAAPGRQHRVPMMAPEPPEDFVARPIQLESLKRKLLDSSGDAVSTTAALRGAGGYGKTTLAKYLAHDPDILNAYFDGVLWVELGEKPANLLGIISDLIAMVTTARRSFDTLNAAAAALAECLGDRRMLLIIDDVWREVDLKPFLLGAPNVTRLITTRLDRLVPRQAFAQPIDGMSAGEALALLS